MFAPRTKRQYSVSRTKGRETETRKAVGTDSLSRDRRHVRRQLVTGAETAAQPAPACCFSLGWAIWAHLFSNKLLA
jgi:hypothetical protein